MNVLETRNLNKIYSNNFKALSNVSLKVEENSFLGLLGKNGAGKTTFIGIINSLIQKTSGKVFVFNKELDKEPSFIKKKIGIVPQELNLPIFETPIEILINQAGYFGIRSDIAKKRAIKYLEILDLYAKRDVQVRALSGGMKRRLMLARALMTEPSLLFLDEPTAGVDIEIRHKIWDFLAALHKEGKTIVLTTHYLEEVEKLCDTLAFLDKGCLTMHDKITNIRSMQCMLIITCNIKNIPITAIERLRKGIKVIGNTITVPGRNHQKSLNEVLRQIMDLGITITHIKTSQGRLEDIFNKMNAE